LSDFKHHHDVTQAYFDGKKAAFREVFQVTKRQKNFLMQWLRTAVHFLAERSLMDYSLMVCQTDC
jgi:hypothetical protein